MEGSGQLSSRPRSASGGERAALLSVRKDEFVAVVLNGYTGMR